MPEFEEKILKAVDHRQYLWWRYIDDIFFIWEHGEEKLKTFLKPSMKFTHQCNTFTAE